MLTDIDRRVAEEVMGFEIKVDRIFIPGDEVLIHGAGRDLGSPFPDKGGWTFAIPPYSTDMNAAMEVVRAVILRFGGTVEMILEDGGWWVVFKIRDGKWEGYKDLSLPMAICLAALEAVKLGE